MIIYLILFLIVVAVSFILAFLSMKDFPDLPNKKNYGVFLIRNPQNLTLELLNLILIKSSKGEIISFEHLFKGENEALVIFGPKNIVSEYQSLNLLELEDYTDVDAKIQAWEVSMKEEFSSKIPPLLDSEQFWWQVTTQGKKENFQAILRAVVISDREGRVKELFNILNSYGLVKKPLPLTSEQILENYKERSLTPLSKDLYYLSSSQVLKLLGKV